MSVTCPGNILRAGAILDSKDALRDHLTSIGANDMHPKHAVRLRLGDELDGALSVEVRLRARIGRKGELADLVLDARGLELLLRLADPGDLGVRVHDGRDRVVVDVPVALGDVLDRGDALLLGLVREHGPEGDVADALDALHARVELVVDHDAALVVELHAGGLEVQALGVWPATDGNKNDVRLELQVALVRG